MCNHGTLDTALEQIYVLYGTAVALLFVILFSVLLALVFVFNWTFRQRGLFCVYFGYVIFDG